MHGTVAAEVTDRNVRAAREPPNCAAVVWSPVKTLAAQICAFCTPRG
jgi:hypothetical protein